MSDEPFRLGTRGSALARRQAELVRDRLDRRHDPVEIVPVETTGDRLDETLIQRLGKTGAFVRDLDERVLAGELDAAVHSLKDMPTDMPSDLVVAAIPDRAPANDVLVTHDGGGIEELPKGGTIGTASLRRRAQLRAVRPDLEITPIRGNVDTRLEKLLGPHLRERRAAFEDEEARQDWQGELSPLEARALEREGGPRLDGLVLAAAGLERSDLIRAVPTARFPLEDFVPAPGQGAIAVTMADTDRAEAIHQRLDHPPSRVAATVERILLADIGGGCIAPIGIHAVVQGEVVNTRVQVLDVDGTDRIDAQRDLPVERHVAAAHDFGEDLVAEGAAELLEEAADAVEE